MANNVAVPATAGPGTYQIVNNSMDTNSSNVTRGSEGICKGNIFYHPDLTQMAGVSAMFVILYIIVMFLSVSGNLMVIWTVWRHKYMHTVTNYYLVNLATSDLLVSALVLPLKLLEYTAPCDWQVFHSDMLCSFQYYLLPIFVFASVLTLVAISFERFYAIVHPLSSMKIHSKSRTRRILACTWLLPAIVALPFLYCRSYATTLVSEMGQINRQICNDKFDQIDMILSGDSGSFRRGYFIFLFLLVYLVPMAIIVCTCLRIAICLLRPQPIISKQAGGGLNTGQKQEENKRKVARMIIVVAISFIVCWSPQYLVSIISQMQTVSFLRRGNFFFTMLLTHLMGFLNSCVNPFIYTAMSERFRRHFKIILMSPCLFFSPNRKNRRIQFSDRMSSAFMSTSKRGSTSGLTTTEVPLTHVTSSHGQEDACD